MLPIQSEAAMTIQFRCPGCNSKLNAKESLAGQTRDCPKCQTTVTIPGPSDGGQPQPAKPVELPESDDEPAAPAEEPSTEPARPQGFDALDEPLSHVTTPDEGQETQQAMADGEPGPSSEQVHDAIDEELLGGDRPTRLNRQHRYVIVDRQRVVAAWKNDGNGWQLKTVAGMVDAGRSPEELPPKGDFRLVELKTDAMTDGMHLRGLAVYQLSSHYAMTKLQRGDDDICHAIEGPGSLGKDQKNSVRQYIRDAFMQNIWENATEVLEYLGNTDYHSSGVG
jgi:hypothetical protein